jgi:hypothetical protein
LIELAVSTARLSVPVTVAGAESVTVVAVKFSDPMTVAGAEGLTTPKPEMPLICWIVVPAGMPVPVTVSPTASP